MSPILKSECIYRHKPASCCAANEMIDHYIYFTIFTTTSVFD